MAEDALNTAVELKGIPTTRQCSTSTLKLLGGQQYRPALHTEVGIAVLQCIWVCGGFWVLQSACVAGVQASTAHRGRQTGPLIALGQCVQSCLHWAFGGVEGLRLLVWQEYRPALHTEVGITSGQWEQSCLQLGVWRA